VGRDGASFGSRGARGGRGVLDPPVFADAAAADPRALRRGLDPEGCIPALQMDASTPMPIMVM